MSRALKRKAALLTAKAKRAYAIERTELRGATAPRAPASSPTAMAVKVTDPATRAMIDAAVAARSMTSSQT